MKQAKLKFSIAILTSLALYWALKPGAKDQQIVSPVPEVSKSATVDSKLEATPQALQESSLSPHEKRDLAEKIACLNDTACFESAYSPSNNENLHPLAEEILDKIQKLKKPFDFGIALELIASKSPYLQKEALMSLELQELNSTEIKKLSESYSSIHEKYLVDYLLLIQKKVNQNSEHAGLLSGVIYKLLQNPDQKLEALVPTLTRFSRNEQELKTWVKKLCSLLPKSSSRQKWIDFQLTQILGPQKNLDQFCSR